MEGIIFSKVVIKVAIDSGAMGGGHGVRGIGFYAKNLVAALKKTKGVKVEMVDFLGGADLAKYDVVHYPYFDLFFDALPSKKLTKTVVTIHDVTPLIYPKQYPPGVRGKINFVRQKKSLKTVDKVVTDTEASKKDIVRFLGVPKEKIKVVHLAPANPGRVIKDKSRLEKVRKKYDLPKKFVLYVGDVNYNKNISRLVRACEKVGVKLVIVGKQAKKLDEGSNLADLKGPMDWVRFLVGKDHPEEAHYTELIRLFESKSVMRLGFVSDEDLVAIYNLATVYCQPSLYEGFGLPPLEAMASGCPVVASRTQAVVEVCGEGARYFDPKDENEMSKVIKKIVKSEIERKRLVEKGRKNVGKYSWRKAANETAQVYKEVCEY